MNNKIGSMYGHVYKANHDYQTSTQLALCWHKGQLLVRYKDLNPKPFAIIDPNTLEELSDEIEFAYDKREEGEGRNKACLEYHEWENADKEEGRYLCCTPVMSHNNNLYVISDYRVLKEKADEDEEEDDIEEKEKELKTTKNILEIYEGTAPYKFIKSVDLMTEK